MKVLITGAAGFIGFSLCNYLCKFNYDIYGIDNFDDYYDIKIKRQRINFLKTNYKKFKFAKIDIVNFKKLNFYVKKNKINYIINLAAQAGVRYSIQNPKKYIQTNINVFFNILETSRINKIKRLIYASSSSVYGDNKIFPLKEKFILRPKNIYGLSKKNNEEMAQIYFNFYGLKSIGLRFFTVYGEWGRPDMLIMKYMNAYKNKKTFYINNYGKHDRDFTYIGDVIKFVKKVLDIQSKLPNTEIMNICSNRPINILKIIELMKKNKINPIEKKISFQRADVLKTHGDNSKIKKFTKIKRYLDWKIGVQNTINWWKLHYKIK